MSFSNNHTMSSLNDSHAKLEQLRRELEEDKKKEEEARKK